MIINCARGGIINEIDLLKALKEGKVSAAGLDVFENEPPDFSTGLIQHPSVVSTPHLGASTEEAQQKVAIQIAEQIVAYFKNGSSTGAVNSSGINEIPNENLKAYVKLSEQMGKLLSQIRNDSLVRLSITFYGDLFKGNEKIISSALLKGFLMEQLDINVNFINAPVLADELGIVLDETISSEQHNYLNLIEIKMITISSRWSFSGTVFGNRELRIVEINDFPVEFKPEGSILIYLNIDKPGMLSSVSSKLAAANINIASLSLGRKTEGDHALTVVNIDSPINAELENTISEIEGIKDTYTVYI